MNDPQPRNQRGGTQLNYRSAHADRHSRDPFRLVGWLIGGFVVIALLVVLVPVSVRKRHEPSRISHCASNLKNIAAAMIEYSNKNNGHYPDRIEELEALTDMTTEIFVCPATHDVAATGTLEQKVAALAAGGHCSYIYLAKGLTSDLSEQSVLLCEPLANHANAGMNVLFGDYHVEFIDAKTAQAMLKSIVPGRPLVWPPGSATAPTTQGN